MTPPPNAPIFQHLSRPAYISGIHVTRGIIIRYVDVESEFTTIPHDDKIIEEHKPQQILKSLLINKNQKP